jgi:hypothetical protein
MDAMSEKSINDADKDTQAVPDQLVCLKEYQMRVPVPENFLSAAAKHEGLSESTDTVRSSLLSSRCQLNLTATPGPKMVPVKLVTVTKGEGNVRLVRVSPVKAVSRTEKVSNNAEESRFCLKTGDPPPPGSAATDQVPSVKSLTSPSEVYSTPHSERLTHINVDSRKRGTSNTLEYLRSMASSTETNSVCTTLSENAHNKSTAT